MTSDGRRPQEHRLDDERCANALLAEGGFPDDAELRTVLLQLRELRVTEVPEPSPEVAALMGRPEDTDVVSVDDWTRRHPRKKRAVFTTLAVAASLGAAGGAAAGSETLRSQTEGTVSSIIRSFSPPVPATPEPTTTAPASPPPAEAPKPAPAVVPSPAGSPSEAALPAAPVPAGSPGLAPYMQEQQEAKGPRHVRQAPQNVSKGAPSAVPQGGGKPADPGASRPAGPPPRAGEPASGRAGVPVVGQTKTKADADGRPGPSGAQPRPAPTHSNRP